MNILTRFRDILSVNINSLLDKAEDPQKMIDQYLRKAMDDLSEVKENTAAIMAEEKRCKRLLDANNDDIEKYKALALRALNAGNDDDARAFLAKKQECENNSASLQKTYDIAHSNAEKMRQMHDKLVADIELLRARRANIKAQMALANTQNRLNKANSAVNGIHGALSDFERMEEKASRMLDESMSISELSAPADNSIENLERKYGSVSASSVDAELEELKKLLGKD